MKKKKTAKKKKKHTHKQNNNKKKTKKNKENDQIFLATYVLQHLWVMYTWLHVYLAWLSNTDWQKSEKCQLLDRLLQKNLFHLYYTFISIGIKHLIVSDKWRTIFGLD